MEKKLIYFTIGFVFLVVTLSSYLVFAQGSSFDPEDDREIGYEFLDNNSVVHIWNTQDDYFFEKDAGIQLTNHYEDYWTRNIFCIGYYAGDIWNKIKCSDELTNFQKNIESDDLTYVNATLWKDISYNQYDLRLGINYYLGLNDKNLSITIYMKNIGIDIPFDLGFAWKVMDLDVPSNETTDKILINSTIYNLDGIYDLIFKDMKEYMNISFPTNQTLGNGTVIYNYSIEEVPIPFYKIYDRFLGKKNFLRIDWDENLNYTIKMYGDGNQENFYVALLVNAGHFNPNQEKSTTFYWIDAEFTGNGEFSNNIGVSTAAAADYNMTLYTLSDGILTKIRMGSSEAATVTSQITIYQNSVQLAKGFITYNYNAAVDVATLTLGLDNYSNVIQSGVDGGKFTVWFYKVGGSSFQYRDINGPQFNGTYFEYASQDMPGKHAAAGAGPLFTFNETEEPSTCTYSSGNWDVNCSENCSITSNVNLGGNNLILSGSGTFSLQAEIRNYNEINIWDGCDLLIESSGSIRGN